MESNGYLFWAIDRCAGAVAQLGERLPCTQEVRSSILLGSTKTHYLEIRETNI